MTRRPARSGEMTICFDIWNPNPIFHEWAGYDANRQSAFTHCGRLIDSNRWGSTRMRRDHAERIGRACAVCFKKGMDWIPRFTTSHQNWSHA